MKSDREMNEWNGIKWTRCKGAEEKSDANNNNNNNFIANILYKMLQRWLQMMLFAWNFNGSVINSMN